MSEVATEEKPASMAEMLEKMRSEGMHEGNVEEFLGRPMGETEKEPEKASPPTEEAKEDPRIAFIKRSLGLYKDLTGKIQKDGSLQIIKGF